METFGTGLDSIERKRISKLHILVHPGFIMEEDLREDQPYEEDTEAGTKLLIDYEEKAKTLGQDEVMVIIAPSRISLLKKHKKLDKPYVQTIEKIKSILGDRVIVLMDRLDFFQEEEVRDKLKRVLTARGYYFDENVLSEAYGETLGCCVDDAAESFNRGEKLNNKTIVKIDLTDGKGSNPEKQAEQAKKFGYKNINFE